MNERPGMARARAANAVPPNERGATPNVSARVWQAACVVALLAAVGCAPMMVMRPGVTRPRSEAVVSWGANPCRATR